MRKGLFTETASWQLIIMKLNIITSTIGYDNFIIIMLFTGVLVLSDSPFFIMCGGYKCHSHHHKSEPFIVCWNKRFVVKLPKPHLEFHVVYHHRRCSQGEQLDEQYNVELHMTNDKICPVVTFFFGFTQKKILNLLSYMWILQVF